MPAWADNQAIALHQMLPPIQKKAILCTLCVLVAKIPGKKTTFIACRPITPQPEYPSTPAQWNGGFHKSGSGEILKEFLHR